jgi:flagellar M-ring protein FliF
MPQQVDQMMSRISRSLSAYTIGQKFVAGVMLLAVLAGGFVFMRWATAPSYAPLFTNLAGSDASAVVDKLDADGVKYKLTDGGQTVLVPKEQVYGERVKLSGAGLPAAKDTGYSLLDQQGVTASQFQQQVAYQRAMEGELAKTIQAIDGVRTSVVHLAVPQRDVFLDTQEESSASVLVDTQPGRDLSRQQVQSIVHLVASSIQGMKPEQVTVVDGQGQLLSSPDAVGGAGGGADGREQMTAEYETRQAAALQSVLDKVLGPGHAVARVTATLQFDSIDTTTEQLTGDPKAPPIAESTTTETYAGGAGTSGGVLGPDNIAVPTDGGTTAGSYEKKTSTRNNTISKVTEKKKSAPGAVAKQSVAVVVDSSVKGVQLADLETMVTSAAGIDTARGDTLSVTSMSFDTTATAKAAEEIKQAQAVQQREQLFGYVKQGAIALVLLLAALLAWVTRRKRRAERQSEAFLELERVEQASSMGRAIGSESHAAIESADGAPALEGGAGSDSAPGGQMRRKDDLAALVERQPDEVAELLRGWLADRRG